MFLNNLLPAILLGSGLVCGLGAMEDQDLLNLPAPVKATALLEANGHAITKIQKETEEGVVVYHISIAQDGIDKRVTVLTDGTVSDRHEFSKLNGAIEESKEAGKEAWEKTKEVSEDVWDKTKQVTKDGVESTKEAIHDVTAPDAGER